MNCSVWVNVKHSLFGGSSYNCRRQEAAWSGNWESDEGLNFLLFFFPRSACLSIYEWNVLLYGIALLHFYRTKKCSWLSILVTSVTSVDIYVLFDLYFHQYLGIESLSWLLIFLPRFVPYSFRCKSLLNVGIW